MGKTSTISARIDPKTKEQAERIFEKLGLTASQASTLFYRQVELHRGLPFPVELPNETTRKDGYNLSMASLCQGQNTP